MTKIDMCPENIKKENTDSISRLLKKYGHIVKVINSNVSENEIIEISRSVGKLVPIF